MSERAKPPACYRDRNNGVRFIKSEHRLDCATDCKGCKPCPERWHCTLGRNCTWHLEDGQLTCGRCLAAVRRHLRRIGDLSALMLPAAIDNGVNSEAANLAGPAADYDTLIARRVIDQRWIDQQIPERNRIRAADALIEDDDEHHPYNVTTRWQMMLSEDYRHPLPKRLSITGAVDYLDRNLHRIAQDDEQDFPLLGRELKKCSQHLEAVLRNDNKPERGAPCPSCTSEATGVGPRLRREYAHWCKDEECERFHHDDDEADVWQCPRDSEHWWSHEDYTRWIEERKKPA